uniref:Uncharacterized protein n=1 Tax=Anguilla anguilla TaxID=7936 RepID=A0A0E9P6S1_ANGAN
MTSENTKSHKILLNTNKTRSKPSIWLARPTNSVTS